MPNQNEKPAPFKAGATSISAKALNDMRAAIPRSITGGNGINVQKFGDGRYVIQLADAQGSAPGAMAIARVVTIHDTYLVCTKDGATINVAKPWPLRRGVVWPVGPTYTYSAPGVRQAVQSGFTTENQRLTPDYQVDEYLLVVRLPSARINTDAGVLIQWVDMNNGGRSWATV